MEIDPRKMDFDKMKSDNSPGENVNAKRINDVSGINNAGRANENAGYNPAPSFTPPSNPAPMPNSNQPFVSLQKPTELLSEAWQLYKAKWKTFLGIVVVPILLIFFMLMIFAIGLWGSGMMDKSSSGALFFENIIFIFIFSILFYIFFILMMIIQFWSQAALIYAIKERGEIGIKEAYQKSKSKIKPFFWVSILVGFITMGGFILFAIPGYIFAVWFAFAIFIVIAEDLKGMDAILKSREYVRGHWWQTLWRFLFIYLVMFGIIIVASVAFILLPILGNIVSVILTPLIMIYLFLVYQDLKRIKGDFEFQPSAKAKKLFVAIGIIGTLIMFIIFSLLFFFMFSNLDSAMDKAINEKPRFDSSRINDLEIIFEGNIEEKIKMRDEWRISHLNTIFTMLQFYKTKNETYPVSKMTVRLKNNYITDKLESISSESIPLDPKDPEYYYSYQSSDGESFELTARLENIDHPDCDLEIKAGSNICIYRLLN